MLRNVSLRLARDRRARALVRPRPRRLACGPLVRAPGALARVPCARVPTRRPERRRTQSPAGRARRDPAACWLPRPIGQSRSAGCCARTSTLPAGTGVARPAVAEQGTRGNEAAVPHPEPRKPLQAEQHAGVSERVRLNPVQVEEL